jgi:hypothetical protein
MQGGRSARPHGAPIDFRSLFVPCDGRVLAGFKPQWLDLNFVVAGFAWEPNSPHVHLFGLGHGTMAASKDYERFAARCLQEARITADFRHKSFLVEMAQAWLRLAEQAKNVKGAQVYSVSAPDRGD